MNARRVKAAAAAILVALLGACSSPAPSGRSTPLPTTASPTGSPTPKQPQAEVVVYLDRGDLWVYRVESDSVKRLTFDGYESWEWPVSFRDAGRVTYTVANAGELTETIEDLDLSSGQRTTLTGFQGFVGGLDWSPDGSTLAFVGSLTDKPSVAVYLYTPADGKTRRIRDLLACGDACGRGGTDFDQQKVAWAPDGSALLVTDTTLDNHPGITMYLLDPSGKDIVAPRSGTQGIWSPDSMTIYYVRWSLGSGPRAAYALEVAKDRRRELPLTGFLRLAVSPDGKLLAYDDGKAKANLYLYDLGAGVERKVSSSTAGPLWLTSSRLATTYVRPCEDEECGEAPLWVGVGTVRIVAPKADARNLSIASTAMAETWWA